MQGENGFGAPAIPIYDRLLLEIVITISDFGYDLFGHLTFYFLLYPMVTF